MKINFIQRQKRKLMDLYAEIDITLTYLVLMIALCLYVTTVPSLGGRVR